MTPSTPSQTNLWPKTRPLLIGGVALALLVAIGYWGGAVKTGPLFIAGLVVLSAMILAFGLLTWWLYLSPMPSPARAQSATASPALRQLVSVLVIISSMLFVVGAFWDEVWHRTFGSGIVLDDFFWRPHQLIYGSMGLTALFAVGGLFNALRGRGSIRQRFRAEPMIGLLALAAFYLSASGPSDLIWHQIYGLDITAWSLPHLFLTTGSIFVTLTAIALQLSLLPRHAWRGLPGLQLQEALAVLVMALALLFCIQFSTTEWDGLHAIGDASRVSFWSRPEWLYPVVVVSVSIFFGAFAVRALRRAGVATLVMLVMLVMRLLLLTALGVWNSEIGMGLNAHLLMFPAALAMDAWHWARLKSADSNATLIGGNLVGATASLVVSLIAIPALMIYPRINAGVAPLMILMGLVAALWFGWVGASLGGWLGGLGRPAEAAEPLSPRVVWAGVGVLAASIAFAAFFILTATAPTV
ncbi:MAG: hypothetical protein HYZ49_00185 [Chloroflexi bacterium]|nr:hypothetical protein [Chloroflexota bacterium]